MISASCDESTIRWQLLWRNWGASFESFWKFAN